MGKPKAPKAPDYAAAAKEQGAANVTSAIATNFLNQANQVGPDGSLTYNYDYANAMTLPDGTRIPLTTATTTLSPEQQKLYDQNNQISSSLNDMAIKGIGYVDQASGTPIDQSGFPSLSSGLAVSPFKTGVGTTAGNMTSGVNTPGYKLNADPTTLGIQGDINGTDFQKNYDFSGVSPMMKAEDFTGQRDKITDAMMQRLQPYLDKERSALDTRLANQGITKGSEAYNWDQDTFNRGANDQRIAALLAGDQEQQNLFNNSMALRQQGVGEAINQGNFANNAASSAFAQNLAQGTFANQAQGQQFGQNAQKLQDYNSGVAGMFTQGLANANLANEVQNQQFQQDQQNLGNFNQAQEAMFNQALASGQFNNQARQQAIQEADYFKNQPLNMLNALRSGNQVSMPSFGNVTAGSSIAAAPVYAAANDQYQAALDAYKTKMAGFSGMMSGLGGLGGAAIGKWG